MSGRFADAERLTLASIAALLRPRLLLVSTRLDLGNKAGARLAFNRLKEIRPDQPGERAMLHAVSGSLLQSAGQNRQAEAAYLAALNARSASQHPDTVDAAAVFPLLATLYLQAHRLDEATRSLIRASAIFSQIPAAAPIDLSKLLAVRGARLASLRQSLTPAHHRNHITFGSFDRSIATPCLLPPHPSQPTQLFFPPSNPLLSPLFPPHSPFSSPQDAW